MATDTPMLELRKPGFSSAVVEGKPPHWPLPESGTALTLVPSDFDNAATELNVEAAVIRAVALVESSGRGFDDKSRPKLRFETHRFRKHTDRFYDKAFPELSNKYKSKLWYAAHTGDPDLEWNMLKKAWALDEADPGIISCSWGMFQVMGENYKMVGWSSLKQFVEDMFYSEYQHLRAFLGYCRAAKLIAYLQESPPDFSNFALGYNGPDTESYATKMQNYYDQFTQNR